MYDIAVSIIPSIKNVKSFLSYTGP